MEKPIPEKVETPEEIQAVSLRELSKAKKRLREKDLSWADKILLQKHIQKVEKFMEKCYRCGKPLSVMEMEAGKGEDLIYCTGCSKEEGILNSNSLGKTLQNRRKRWRGRVNP